jgi:thioredoxin 1
LEKLAKEFEGKAKLFEMDVNKAPNTPTQLGVMAIPTLVFFKEGKEVDRITGGSENAIRGKIEAVA